MSKKMPRFEDGKPLPASKLNETAETVANPASAKASREAVMADYEKTLAAKTAGTLVGTVVKDRRGHEWVRRGDVAQPHICINCGCLTETDEALKDCSPCPWREPERLRREHDELKRKADEDWRDMEQASAHWEREAKKAFAERDELKKRLREASGAIGADEWRRQFVKDIDPATDPWDTNNLGEFFHRYLESIEKENRTIVRMDVPADLLAMMRKLGRGIFDSNTAIGYRDTGLVGVLNLITPIEVYLNNSLGGKARFYLEKVGYREYDYPAAPVSSNLREDHE